MPKLRRPDLHFLIMRQWTLAMVSVFVLLLLLLFAAEYTLKRLAENILTETLETRVEIEDVSIGLLEGTLAFHKARIANLEGFSKPYIFTAENARATGSFSDLLFRNKLRVQLIEIDHIQTWIQKNADGYNYQALLKNLQEPPANGSEEAETSGPDQGTPPSSSSEGDLDIEIREIRLTHVRTAVYDFIPSPSSTPESEEAERLELKWKTIELRDIDLGEGGRQAARHLSQLITEALLTATARKVGSLPIHLVEKGFSLGGATLKVIGEETHTDELSHTLQDMGRGAAEWLHRIVPHSEEEKASP